MQETRLSLSGIGVTFSGLPRAWIDKMSADWAAFLAPALKDSLLQVQVELDDPADVAAPFEPHELSGRITDGAGEFRLPGGRARLEREGSVRIRLDSSSRESYFNMVNLLLASLAVRLPSRQAALLHAACLIVEDRAYLLVGAAGAGKSSWTRLGQEAGCVAVSDDLVLVQGTEVLGSPFRSRHLPGEALPGRWPLSAVLFPRHGKAAERNPAPRLLSMARLTANLPFVSAATEQDPSISSFLDRLVTAVPCYELTFTLDPSFLPFLD